MYKGGAPFIVLHFLYCIAQPETRKVVGFFFFFFFFKKYVPHGFGQLSGSVYAHQPIVYHHL